MNEKEANGIAHLVIQHFSLPSRTRCFEQDAVTLKAFFPKH